MKNDKKDNEPKQTTKEKEDTYWRIVGLEGEKSGMIGEDKSLSQLKDIAKKKGFSD